MGISPRRYTEIGLFWEDSCAAADSGAADATVCHARRKYTVINCG
jgi:hypothetical protein